MNIFTVLYAALQRNAANKKDKKAVLQQGNRAMPQLFIPV